MDKLSDNAHLSLAVVTLAIVLTALTSACDSAQAKSPASAQTDKRAHLKTQPPQKPRYFGDEYAQAQQALKDKPAAEMPQAF